MVKPVSYSGNCRIKPNKVSWVSSWAVRGSDLQHCIANAKHDTLCEDELIEFCRKASKHDRKDIN